MIVKGLIEFLKGEMEIPANNWVSDSDCDKARRQTFYDVLAELANEKFDLILKGKKAISLGFKCQFWEF